MKDTAELFTHWEYLGTFRFEPLPKKYHAEYTRVKREIRRLIHDANVERGMIAFRRIFGESS